MELTALKAYLQRHNVYRLATFELVDVPGFVISALLWGARESTTPHEFSPGEVHPVLTDVLVPGPRLPRLRLQAAATDL